MINNIFIINITVKVFIILSIITFVNYNNNKKAHF